MFQSLLDQAEDEHSYSKYVEKLKQVFYQYGELRQAPAIAREIVSERKKEEIKTSKQLKVVLKRFLNHKKENKVLAQIYQAIRIEVNQEIEVLKELLLQMPEILKKGGRLAFISYHSLEDRLVKNLIQKGKFEGEVDKDFYGNAQLPLHAINRKPILPETEEIEQNSRARSAKLRIAEKV